LQKLYSKKCSIKINKGLKYQNRRWQSRHYDHITQPLNKLVHQVVLVYW
jgi:hypothetical protein